jgi:hypothetical protein
MVFYLGKNERNAMKKRLYTKTHATERFAYGWKQAARVYIAFHFGADAVNRMDSIRNGEESFFVVLLYPSVMKAWMASV